MTLITGAAKFVVVVDAGRRLQRTCHEASKQAGWWDKVDVHEAIPTKLLLIHSEISEACEGFRKDLMDEHLPERKMIEVELADALHRIFDLAGALDLDVGEALAEKIVYNETREDHQMEARNAPGGKRF